MNASSVKLKPGKSDTAGARCNVADFIAQQAEERPDQTAVIEAWSGRELTYAELDRNVNSITRGLRDMGIADGTRTALAVKPGIEFVETVFALFRVGAVPVVVDPGMGKDNMLKCVAEAEPEAMVGITAAHALSKVFGRAFKTVTRRVTIGRKLFWGGETLKSLKERSPESAEPADTRADTTAGILFTSGATGIPKGVIFEHGVFVGQTRMIRDAYDIQPGEVDVPCFALFALFSVAMGVTIVLPEMDFAKPATVDPAKLVKTIRDHNATMSFGSPAVWRRVGPYLVENNLKLPSIKRILIAGAPVPYETLAMFKGRLAEGGDLHTPYGATESLPFTTISASEILGETKLETQAGAGTCVGKPLAGVEGKVIRLTEGPIDSIDDVEELPPGEIGEIIVRSEVTTREYFQRPENTRLAKIRISDTAVPAVSAAGVSPLVRTGRMPVSHRMGDMGYFDDQGRLWFCGRVNHRVVTSSGTLYPVKVEALFNNHDAVARCALVGVGDRPRQTPAIVVELHGQHMPEEDLQQRIRDELLRMARAHEMTREIRHVLFKKELPVDVRHNAKIDRDRLARWAGFILPKEEA